MDSKFCVIVIEVNDGQPPRMVSPPEALYHARAQYYQTRYSAVMFLVVTQVMMAALMAFFGVAASSILIANLGGALAIGAFSYGGAWVTRKGLIR